MDYTDTEKTNFVFILLASEGGCKLLSLRVEKLNSEKIEKER